MYQRKSSPVRHVGIPEGVGLASWAEVVSSSLSGPELWFVAMEIQSVM